MPGHLAIRSITTACSLVGAAALLTGCGTKEAARTTTVQPLRTPSFTQAAVSSNWAGYVARRAAGNGFDRAAGRFRVPRISCAQGTGSSAAFWVGIGGWTARSPSLQQLGASADCSPTGVAAYRLWTEIVPAPPTFLSLRVGPGDLIEASVAVAKGAVSFTLRNLTRHGRYAVTVRPKGKLDLGTAEWIAEAPSICRTIDVCQVVTLSDFGRVAFTSVSAGSGDRIGPLGSPDWRVTPVALVTSSGSSRYIASSNSFGAAPGATSVGGRAFTIDYRPSLGGTVPPRPLPGAPVPAWVR